MITIDKDSSAQRVLNLMLDDEWHSLRDLAMQTGLILTIDTVIANLIDAGYKIKQHEGFDDSGKPETLYKIVKAAK
jgi:biotin operon repressor